MARPKKVAPAVGTKIKSGRTRYSISERMTALATIEEIGLENASATLDIPLVTLRSWKYGYRQPDSLALFQLCRGDLAKAFAAMAWDALALAAERMDSASYSDLIRSAAICTDKDLLLRGKPTSYNHNQNNNTNLNIDLAKLSPKERAALEVLLMKAQSGAESNVQPERPAIGEASQAETQGAPVS